MGCNMSSSRGDYAIYQDFYVLGKPSMGELIASPDGRPVTAAVYIQVNDGSIFALKDLPESVAANELEASDSTDIRPGDAIYLRGRTLLKFTQGILTYATIGPEWHDLKISSIPKGPFYKFPLTREQIVELFGKPLEWKRRPKPPSGP